MQQFQESRNNEKFFREISYLLISLMMGCAAWTVGTLAAHWDATWPVAPLTILLTLLAGERLYTYRRFKSLELFSREWFIAFGTQWIVIISALKLVTGLSGGWQAFLAEIPRWGSSLFTDFITFPFFLSILLALVTWGICSYFAALLDEMGLDEALIRRELVATSAKETEPARNRLLGLVFGLGNALVLFTALTRIDARAVFAQIPGPWLLEIPILSGGGASTLLYFMLSMGLFSQTQFVSLNTIWGLRHIPVNRELGHKWVTYSLVFLVLLVALVSLMPTNYSMGLLDSIGYALSLVFYAVGVMLALVAYALVSVASLFNFDTKAFENIKMPPMSPEALPAVEPTTTAVPWWLMLKSVVSWALFITLLAFAIVQFIRQNKEILAALTKAPGGGWLVKVIAWLKKMITGAGQSLKKAVENGLERLRSRGGSGKINLGDGFLSLRGLDSRQKVYFYYQALIRKSGEIGLTRNLSQTPYEFASTLDKSLPEADSDVNGLTEAFIEARYSRHPVGTEKASQVKIMWEHLRKMLREKKSPPESK